MTKICSSSWIKKLDNEVEIRVVAWSQHVLSVQDTRTHSHSSDQPGGPSRDCTRVFSVSSGCKGTSTAIPANLSCLEPSWKVTKVTIYTTIYIYSWQLLNKPYEDLILSGSSSWSISLISMRSALLRGIWPYFPTSYKQWDGPPNTIHSQSKSFDDLWTASLLRFQDTMPLGCLGFYPIKILWTDKIYQSTICKPFHQQSPTVFQGNHEHFACFGPRLSSKIDENGVYLFWSPLEPQFSKKSTSINQQQTMIIRASYAILCL